MNATLSLDEAGRLVLPNTALRVLGMKPGDQVRADVSPHRIDICPEPPVMAQGVIESGVLVMARQGIRMDAAAAVRATVTPGPNALCRDERFSRQLGACRGTRPG